MDMMDSKHWSERDLDMHLDKLKSEVTACSEPIFIAPFVESSVSKDGALSGAFVSVKATFDVAGHPTTMGSKLLGKKHATRDADAVALLRAAGASLIGHTNMTELAYSGVGLNPHFGTPENPLKQGRIPGGSTSGGAVSVATGLADIALGTDTGGSLRIPAAFCGLVGFKPSQQSVSSKGCLPLSQSLDSIGVMANSVNDCSLAWHVLSDKKEEHVDHDFVLKVPTNFGMDEASSIVREAFDSVIKSLQDQGLKIERGCYPIFEAYQQLPVWQFSAVESRRYFENLIDLESELLDPRVRQRIARGKGVTDEEFSNTQRLRHDLIERMSAEEANTVFIMPTVACIAPDFSDFATDEDFNRINLLCLRNTSFANVIDGCSLSLPFTYQGEPIGLMLTAKNGDDQKLLSLAQTIERLLCSF